MDEQASRSGGPIDRSRWLFAALSVVAVAYAFVGAWLVTAGPSDPVAHTTAFLAHLVSPWMLATYVVAAVFIAYGAWYLHRLPQRVEDDRPIDTTMRRTALQFAMVLMVVAASLAGIAWLYVRDLENALLSERAAQQDLVARLKAQQIDKWLVESTVDSDLLARSLARMPLDRLPGDHDLRRLVELVFAETLAANPDRVAATLFAPDGTVLVHAGATPDRQITEAARGLAGAPATAPRIVDIYNDGGVPSQAHMGFLAPVAGSDASAPLAAVLAFTVDPFRGLLKQVQAWPTPSPSSEVMVVHRDGGDVVFITPPRITPVPAPNAYRVPLATSTLPAAQAMREGVGVHNGRDYRGVEVLTASERVKGVPWLVVAKTDEGEFSAPLERRKRTLALVIGAAIVLAAAMLVVLWRGERAALLTQQQHAEVQHAALSEHFAQLTQLARDIVLMIDPQGRIIEVNQAALDAYGYSKAELLQLTAADLRTPEEKLKFEEQWRNSLETGGLLIETVQRRKDGTSFPVEISGRVIEIDGKPYRQAFIRDISARRAFEMRLARLSQVRAALQAATSILLRAGSEGEILKGVCQTMVRLGGYRGAYVGVPNDDAARSVRLVAVIGVDDRFVANADLTWGEGPRGEGLTGSALRTGATQVNQDTASNPRIEPWRQAALDCGFLSGIGLPLKVDGRVFAALTIFAGVSDAFDRDEMILLAALADDIGFAVARLRAQSAGT